MMAPFPALRYCLYIAVLTDPVFLSSACIIVAPAIGVFFSFLSLSILSSATASSCSSSCSRAPNSRANFEKSPSNAISAAYVPCSLRRPATTVWM